MSSRIKSFHSPHFNDTCAISTDYASPERCIDARQGSYCVLVCFQQVVLIMIDEREPLRRTIVLD